MLDDELEEEDNTNELETRIKAPIVWSRLESGVRIEDLQEKRYEEALELIKDYYLNTHVLYKCINFMEDEESVNEHLSNTKIQMKDKTSLVAIEEATGILIGVMILRIVDREAFSRTLSKVKIRSGQHFATIMKFYNTLENPVDIHKIYKTMKYLKLFTLAIHPKFRQQGLGLEMYKSAIRMAVSLNVPVFAGIFTTTKTQQLAQNLGLKKLNEIFYIRYFEEEQGYYFDTGSGSHSAALMAMNISSVVDNNHKADLNHS